LLRSYLSICENSQQPALGTNCKQFREREQAPHGARQSVYSPDHGVPTCCSNVHHTQRDLPTERLNPSSTLFIERNPTNLIFLPSLPGIIQILKVGYAAGFRLLILSEMS